MKGQNNIMICCEMMPDGNSRHSLMFRSHGEIITVKCKSLEEAIKFKEKLDKRVMRKEEK